MQKILGDSQQLFSFEDARFSVAKVGEQINREFFGETYTDIPVVALTLLNGGVVFAGMLLPYLNFHLQLDSVGVSRYRDKKSGAELQWHTYPRTSLSGTKVLLMDDIYDQGVTLSKVSEWCIEQGAESVHTAVLAWKQLKTASSESSDILAPDFFALKIPDKFVVGLGMDYAGRYRNAAGIYVLSEGGE
ncbi:phosphoribosyltransferase family protein [Teredinibacter haidensis]|uniref:phosphoribosyltransferase family protein n=1 Tax=Teredinibacter haidensis TaxID=2731755 RepID=UPI0009490210|nr:phosphoribosyltransferase family protein [Teredinibacter haidensis]